MRGRSSGSSGAWKAGRAPGHPGRTLTVRVADAEATVRELIDLLFGAVARDADDDRSSFGDRRPFSPRIELLVVVPHVGRSGLHELLQVVVDLVRVRPPRDIRSRRSGPGGRTAECSSHSTMPALFQSFSDGERRGRGSRGTSRRGCDWGSHRIGDRRCQRCNRCFRRSRRPRPGARIVGIALDGLVTRSRRTGGSTNVASVATLTGAVMKADAPPFTPFSSRARERQPGDREVGDSLGEILTAEERSPGLVVQVDRGFGRRQLVLPRHELLLDAPGALAVQRDVRRRST